MSSIATVGGLGAGAPGAGRLATEGTRIEGGPGRAGWPYDCALGGGCGAARGALGAPPFGRIPGRPLSIACGSELEAGGL
jgi:hypothetical protein